MSPRASLTCPHVSQVTLVPDLASMTTPSFMSVLRQHSLRLTDDMNMPEGYLLELERGMGEGAVKYDVIDSDMPLRSRGSGVHLPLFTGAQHDTINLPGIVDLECGPPILTIDLRRTQS